MRLLLALALVVGLAAPAGAQTVHWEARLTWTDNAATPNNDLGYRIERQTAGGSFVFLQNTSADATSFTDVGPLTEGVTYCWRVFAIGASVNSEQAETCGIPTAAITTITTSRGRLRY